jgi:hypothetical protein
MTPRPVEKSDLAKVRSFAAGEFATLVKEVKTHLKNPLAEKNPVFALNFQQICQIENQYVVEDAKGERLVLTDHGMSEEPKTCHLLGLLPPELFTKQTLVARFHHDLDTRKLRIKPLAIVTETQVVRLTF